LEFRILPTEGIHTILSTSSGCLPEERQPVAFPLSLIGLYNLLTKYYSGDKVKRYEMVGVVACMGVGGVCTGFWWGNLWERDDVKDLDIDRRVILKSIFKNWDGLMDWIDLAQVRDRLLALANAVMNLRVP
jgi:hypothetical protein